MQFCPDIVSHNSTGNLTAGCQYSQELISAFVAPMSSWYSKELVMVYYVYLFMVTLYLLAASSAILLCKWIVGQWVLGNFWFNLVRIFTHNTSYIIHYTVSSRPLQRFFSVANLLHSILTYLCAHNMHIIIARDS